jgi:short-subunit dehydrogenase
MEALRVKLAGTNIDVSIFYPGLVSSSIQDAGRNRPNDLAHSQFKRSQEAQERERKLRSDPERAMDPFEAGRLVLRGMRNNDLYILTRAEYEQMLRDRHEAIVSSLPTDLPLTEARRVAASSLSHESIYAVERDRKC